MNIQNWFMGVVEEEYDPLGMGRVKVRCFGHHNPDRNLLPTTDLPWMQTIFPVTAGPAAGEVGSSPTLEKNSIVFGAFYDGGELQDGIILGTVPGGVLKEANYNPETNVGFGSAFGPFGSGIPNAAAPRDEAITTATTGVTAARMANVPDEQYPEPAEGVEGAGNKIAGVAERQSTLGISENAGANRDRGGRIQKYWSATDSPSSSGPWCAAFACWVVKTSGSLPEDKLPKSGFSNNWIDVWAVKNSDIVHVFNTAADAGGIQRGDIIVRKKVKRSGGHISIVTRGSDSNGNYETVDGNYGNSVKKVSGPARNVKALTFRHHILRIKDTGVPPNQGLPKDPAPPENSLFPTT